MIPLNVHEGHSHHPSVESSKAVADSIWEQEHIELVTVGIDIGSSTSHLIFAKIHLQRRTLGLSSRFEVIKREILWQSSILFTPFLANGLIDAESLNEFIECTYFEAGLHRYDVDSGAVILTGEAIKKSNALAIDDLFAKEAGKFVCATAGHGLECILAAHGSGAVQKSQRLKCVLLHVDIGGGTTKIALIDRGRIVSTAAYAIGGRLLAKDPDGVWNRCDDSIYVVAKSLGIRITKLEKFTDKSRNQIIKRLAVVLASVIANKQHDDLANSLLLTKQIEWSVSPQAISFSGGVSEYIYGRETKTLGDIAQDLASYFVAELKALDLPLPFTESQHGIRATVIGASQFTVQVSGKTIFAESFDFLPLRNIPVLHPELDLSIHKLDRGNMCKKILDACEIRDLETHTPLALALHWQGEPSYARLKAIADAIDLALCQPARVSPLILVIDRDVGCILGRILGKELGKGFQLISLDGVTLSNLDFIDVGNLINPPGVIPLVIKSLIFDSTQHIKH